MSSRNMKLQDKYKKEIIPAMKAKFGYGNDMAVPRAVKVSVNTGFGRLVVGKSGEEQKKVQESISGDLSLITGQRPVLTRAKKSISAFKLRENMVIGAKVTLRKNKMNDFLTRLINVALPRSRDFRGIPEKSVDKNGNLTIGVKEHIAFPEVSPERVKQIFGFEITIATNAKSREEAIELFKLMGFPIKS